MNKQRSMPHESSCGCADCAAGKRNRFFRGKTMKVPEFQMEQDYGIERRRLLTRAIAGWGVVFGMAVEGAGASTPDAGVFKILRGLALDRHGREAVIDDVITIGSNNTFLIESGAGGCQLKSIEKIAPGGYVLAIHYAERQIGDAVLPDDCDCGKPERNYVCETVLLSLTKICDEKCPCGEPNCERECPCCSDGCCSNAGRGPHTCLCRWSAKAEIAGDPGKLCQWRGFGVDPQDGVDLACMRISKPGDECNPAIQGWVINDCSPRRIVKSNDILYDLIRGCDVTRIKCISWGKWHRHADPISWKHFMDLLHSDIPSEDDHVTALSVTFTAPVRTSTVTPDCFAFTFRFTGEDTGWYETRPVLITRVLTSPPEWKDPLNTTRSATLCVDSDWYEEVRSHASKFKKEGATVRLEVCGDFILDCHGQAVDANAHGFALRDHADGRPIVPSGNGTPGGTLVSVFRIEQRPPTQKTHNGQKS